MFIGHYGVALAAKRLAPRASLGTLVLAAEFVDALWPIFLMVGIEHVRIAPGITRVSPLDFYDYPISHSLLTGIGWAAAFGLIYFALRRYARGAWLAAALVLSHWFLDALVHRPDMPLTPNGRVVGLGLWNSLAATVVVEGGLLVLGLVLYLRTTAARDGIGHWAFWTLIVLLSAIWISSLRGLPPPSLRALEWSALSLWITVPWAWWADRHRDTRQAFARPAATS
jgi:hypothetical protein